MDINKRMEELSELLYNIEDDAIDVENSTRLREKTVAINELHRERKELLDAFRTVLTWACRWKQDCKALKRDFIAQGQELARVNAKLERMTADYFDLLANRE